MGRCLVTFALVLTLAASVSAPRDVYAAEPARTPIDAVDPAPNPVRPWAPADSFQPPLPPVPRPLNSNQPPDSARPVFNPVVQVQNTAPPIVDPNSVNAQVVVGQPVQNGSPPPPATAPSVPAAPPRTNPGSTGGANTFEPPIFESPTLPLPSVDTRKLKIGNRFASSPMNVTFLNMENGDQIGLLTGGIKLLVTFEDKDNTILDIEADQIVVWQNGGKAKDLVDAMSDRDGATQGSDRQTEVYLTGNVVIRYGSGGIRNPDGSPVEDKTMRADRVYYDMARNKAIAVNADLEMFRPGFLAVPSHFKSEELWQLSTKEFKARRAQAAASVLPANPGLDLWMRDLTITEESNRVQRTVFGFPVIDRFSGEDVIGNYRRFDARNTFLEVGQVPVWWFPVLTGDVSDPTGPLSNFIFRNDQVFGTQVMTTWSVLELLGIKKLPNERFDLMTDYLSLRGPAIGTAYALAGPRLFGYDAPFNTSLLAYGIYDQGFDRLGGTRSSNWNPPGFRDIIRWRHVQDYDDFSFQGQIAYLSDPNFLEQYYKYVFDMGPNQETAAYLKYQHGNGAATVLVEPNLARPWVTESQWLPKVNGYWLGQSFFDRLTYNAWGSAGYSQLQTYALPVSQIPPTVNPSSLVTNETALNSGRLDLMQELSMPFSLGAFKFVPYVKGDLAYYSHDENLDQRGRLYGGAGARVSLPLTKQYNDVESELLNLNGLNHKMTFVANYYNAWSNTPASLLPQLDRLNDDATQQAVRDITPWQQTFVPGPNGNALFNSPLYDPRSYAIRRLVDTAADTLDSIQVVQAEWRQRWQTKRGYLGQEHTVDYVTLDLSASFFPEYNRDNFGHPVSFLEYYGTWAVGPNNGLTSAGWMDPYAFGTRYWNASAYFNRTDGTNLVLSYRHFDPIGSRQLSGSISYQFSPKYAITFSSAYDFGLSQNQSTSLALTRIGTDLTWVVGFSYNAIINNFSFNFMVTPNLFNRGGSFNSASSLNGRQ